MRHYPAYCPDCKRLWLVPTDSAPSASPTCPRCDEAGRLVPGAYYSDSASLVFEKLEAAVDANGAKPARWGQLAAELEQLLPTPVEQYIDSAFDAAMQELQVTLDPKSGVGKRVALRMLVTIASTLSEPLVRESGVMRLPQTIPGLFDLVPKKRGPAELKTAANADSDSERAERDDVSQPHPSTRP